MGGRQAQGLREVELRLVYWIILWLDFNFFSSVILPSIHTKE